MKISFTGVDAMKQAEDWCAQKGIHVGPVEEGRARGIVKGLGITELGKWTSLSQGAKDSLAGKINQHSSGEVTIYLNDA